MRARLKWRAGRDDVRRGEVGQHQLGILLPHRQELRWNRYLRKVEIAAAVDFNLVVEHLGLVLGDELECSPHGRVMSIHTALVAVGRFDRVAVRTVVRAEDRHVARRPVVPTEIEVTVGDLCGPTRLSEELGLHRFSLGEGPFDVEVVLVARVVRWRARLDECRIDEAVQVENRERAPLGEQP